RDGALMEKTARLTHMPVVRVEMELDELGIAPLRQVEPQRSLRPLVGDAPDASRLLVMDDATADVGIVPVDDVDRAFRADLHVEAEPLRVVRLQEIVAVLAHEARAATLEVVDDHVVLVDVAHEETAAVSLGEGVGEIEARAAVRGGVAMVRDRLQVVVHVRAEVRAALPLVSPALDDVPEVRDDARGDERL